MVSKFVLKICLTSEESILYAEFISKNKDVIYLKNGMNQNNSSPVLRSLSVNMFFIKSITTVTDEEYERYRLAVIKSPVYDGSFNTCACKEIVESDELLEENKQKDLYIPKIAIKKEIQPVNKNEEVVKDKTIVMNKNVNQENANKTTSSKLEVDKDVKITNKMNNERLSETNVNKVVDKISKDHTSNTIKDKLQDKTVKDHVSNISNSKYNDKSLENKNENTKDYKKHWSENDKHLKSKNTGQVIKNIKQDNKTSQLDKSDGVCNVTMTTSKNISVMFKNKKFYDLTSLLNAFKDNMNKYENNKQGWGDKVDHSVIETGKKLFKLGHYKYFGKKQF